MHEFSSSMTRRRQQLRLLRATATKGIEAKQTKHD